MTLLTIWESAQSSIKQKIGDSSYENWFPALHIKEKNPETLIIETPDEFYKNWIIDHYLHDIREAINNTASIHVNLEISIGTQITKTLLPSPVKFENRLTEQNNSYSNLNPRFTFENFVVGSSNHFASAACQAVAESPGKTYNPLFIYGPVGLGKTHLIQAITHYIQIHHPQIKYSFLSSERFTTELIDAIQHRSTPQFRKKYRNIDVLLIDDIHFIAGKESTQEEFFHTFNTLHNNRKQIIITSDRPPKEISNLEERIRSRFAWGLITDIQSPDFETRVAILRKKIEQEPIRVPNEVIIFIAEQIKTNIRELEGALIRVVAYSLLEEKQISLEMTKEILKDMVQESTKKISIDFIIKTVTEHFHINPNDIQSKRRNKNIVFPRQIAMYLSRDLTNHSLPEIGRAFGGKDHTTVLHSCKKIDNDIIKNAELKKSIEKLISDLKKY